MMDGTASLESAIVYLHREATLARSECEYEDFSISIKVLALIRDGWATGPGLFDLACGYAVGLPHSKVFYKRAKRAAFQRQHLLRLIPDYDASSEMPPEDDPTERRRFYGNRFTGRLCDLGGEAVPQNDPTTTRETNANYAAASGRVGDWPEAHDCQSVPTLASAADDPGLLTSYSRERPWRISSDAQKRAWAARHKRRETRAGVMAYFGA
jgi:hypothetical protein